MRGEDEIASCCALSNLREIRKLLQSARRQVPPARQFMRVPLQLCLWAIVLALLCPLLAVGQEVDTLYILKADGVEQTGDNVVTPQWAAAEVYADFLDSIASKVSDARLYWPDGHALDLPRADSRSFDLSGVYDSVAQRDAAFPDGQYQVKINNGSSLAATVNLATNTAPVLRITNYSTLQSARAPVTVTWQAVTDRAKSDVIELIIMRADGTTVLYASSLDGTLALDATSYTLPSNLPPNELFTCYLDYIRVRSSLSSNGFTAYAQGRGTTLRFSINYGVESPKITTAPITQVAGAGRAARFSVTASGSTLSYQWYRNGVAVAGATSATFNIAAVTSADAGTYYVKVSNPAGTVVSDPVELAVGPAMAVTTWRGLANGSAASDGPPGIGTLGRISPGCAVLAPDGESILVVEKWAVRKISPDGAITTVAGSLTQSGEVDGTGAAARFTGPVGIGVAPDGTMYVMEDYGSLRRITPAGVVTTCEEVLENGERRLLHVSGAPRSVAVDAEGNVYLLTVSAVWKYTPSGTLTLWAGDDSPGTKDGVGDAARFNYLSVGRFAPDGRLWVIDNGRVRWIAPNGEVRTVLTSGGSSMPKEGKSPGVYFGAKDIAVSSTGEIYVANNYLILRAMPDGWMTIVAGSSFGVSDGVGTSVQFESPSCLLLKSDGKLLILDDLSQQTIVRVGVLQAGAPVVAAANEPTNASVAPGATTVLRAPDGGATATYQWYRDGVEVAEGSSPTLILSSVQPDQTGTYAVRITNVMGSESTTVGALSLVASATLPSRIMNLSIRTNAGTGDKTLITGFVVSGGGSGDLPLLLRGNGPALGQFGVTDYLGDPGITLFDKDGGQLASNDDWGGEAALSATAARVGAFAIYPTTSRDAALLRTVAPAPHTVQVRGMDGGAGVALVEVYDALEGTTAEDTPRLINISARAEVQSGSGLLIAGFVVSGDTSKTMLIRGVGPTLANYGVTGVLANPKLELYRESTVIASNDDWGGDAQVQAIMKQVGAFDLTSATSKDAALLITLPPGVYSAQVRGVGDTTGVALVEVYEVP